MRIALAVGVASIIIVFTQESILRLGILQRLELATVDYRFQFRGDQHVGPRFRTCRHRRDQRGILPVAARTVPLAPFVLRTPPPQPEGRRRTGGRHRSSLQHAGHPRPAPRRFAACSTAEPPASVSSPASVRPTTSRTSPPPATRPSATSSSPADPSMGLVNVRTDADGVFRSYNTMYAVDSAGGGERRIPTLAFAVLNKYFGLPPLDRPRSARRLLHVRRTRHSAGTTGLRCW